MCNVWRFLFEPGMRVGHCLVHECQHYNMSEFFYKCLNSFRSSKNTILVTCWQAKLDEILHKHLDAYDGFILTHWNSDWSGQTWKCDIIVFYMWSAKHKLNCRKGTSCFNIATLVCQRCSTMLCSRQPYHSNSCLPLAATTLFMKNTRQQQQATARWIYVTCGWYILSYRVIVSSPDN